MSETTIRRAAVAGQFYPAEPDLLRELLQQQITAARPAPPAPQAIVTPHAGLIYSGGMAALAWASAAQAAERIRTVVLLGPSHRLAFHGIAASEASAWETPLGLTTLTDARDLIDVGNVRSLPAAHAQEHCLEVQLPFIQTLLPQARLLPLLVGEASATEISTLLSPYWEDPHCLIAISSDLSHYLPYDEACQRDRQTADAIERADEQAIGPHQACGCRPLAGLLHLARREQARIRTLGLCNSGDTAGDRSRVVGYGAFAMYR